MISVKGLIFYVATGFFLFGVLADIKTNSTTTWVLSCMMFVVFWPMIVLILLGKIVGSILGLTND